MPPADDLKLSDTEVRFTSGRRPLPPLNLQEVSVHVATGVRTEHIVRLVPSSMRTVSLHQPSNLRDLQRLAYLAPHGPANWA